MSTPSANDAAVARFSEDLTALTGPLGDAARIGLAVSGGPDSLALLLLAHAALPGRISVATVDHGLRPEAADEAAMVSDICRQLDVPHQVLMPAERLAGGGNVQERARKLRYGLLEDWADIEGIGVIAIAHHRDDVVESFLMRAIRGSGVSGLARMQAFAPLPYSRSGYPNIVRPLLDWTRAELAAIVEAAGLKAALDPSNTDVRFDRARIRALLAWTSDLDPAGLARTATNLTDAEAALDWMADQAWRSRMERLDSGELRIDPNDLPAEIQRRIAARAIGALSPAWDGDGLDRLVAQLVTGGIATLAGVKASGGEVWRFGIAPAHRGHR